MSPPCYRLSPSSILHRYYVLLSILSPTSYKAVFSSILMQLHFSLSRDRSATAVHCDATLILLSYMSFYTLQYPLNLTFHHMLHSSHPEAHCIAPIVCAPVHPFTYSISYKTVLSSILMQLHFSLSRDLIATAVHCDATLA